MKKSDDVLVTLLASGSTIVAAAERSGLSASTIHRRLADPAFQARVAAFRSEALSRACGRLADGSVEAVDELRALLKSKSENIRLSAARAILDASHWGQRDLDHESRRRALEDDVRELKHERMAKPA